MAEERASVRKPAVVERRTVAASRSPSGAAAARPMPIARSLQQRLGNRATQALAAQVVARSSALGAAAASGPTTGQLSLSQPGDAHEREAESVADKVMRMSDPSATLAPKSSPTGAAIQRCCAEREEEGKGPKVQRKEGSAAAPQIASSVSTGISALKGGGSPLPASSRSFFEPRLGANLSKVRVHTGSQAAETASALNARAFTVGRDIAFNAGQYAPHSQEGQRLLAHELAHVVQQTGTSADGSGGTIMRAGFPGLGLPAGSPGPKYPTPPKQQPSEAAVRAAAEEVVELKGHSTFDPSPALGEMINYLSPQTALSVRVRFGSLAQGRIDIRLRDGNFLSTEDPAMIELKHPAFPGNGYLAPPRLQLSVVNSAVTGRVQFFPWDRLPGSVAGAWLKANPLQALLGWKGVDRIRPALAVNEVKGGVLRYRLENFTYRLDGEWEGLGNFDVTDDKVQFAAETDIKVRGVADAKMPLSWATGRVFGSSKLSLALAPTDAFGGTFSGSLEGSFAEGVTNITGTASYTSAKLNGSVTVKVTTLEEAYAQIAQHLLPGKGKFTPMPGDTKKHVVYGWGVLDFHVNEWLTGRASVVVEPLGYITSFGIIRPTKTFEFLKGDQLSAIKDIGKPVSASAFYPIWLTTGVTGTITGQLKAAGRIGPGRIHEIELSGVFSTNPAVPLEVSVTGVIDLSAIGRLELHVTGTLSYTLVGKYVKTISIQVEVVGDGTLKVYARLEPAFTVEKAKGMDPQIRMRAVLKTAAGVSLGLRGSIKPSIAGYGPTFRTGRYEWPIAGIGLNTKLDYRIGDPQGPELTFDPYKYDESEFHDRALQLLNNKAEKDRKKHETETRIDESKPKPPPGPTTPAKKIFFSMKGHLHELWIESDPTPAVQMASGPPKPLKLKLHAESKALKKQEKDTAGAEQSLVKAQESAVDALLSHTIDVEGSVASLEAEGKPQTDVAGLQELAGELKVFGQQFGKFDVGVEVVPEEQKTGKKELHKGEGRVGTYKNLLGQKGDDLTPHHMPQDKYMEEKLKGNPGGERWDSADGICMNMYHPLGKVREGRHFYTRSYAGRNKEQRFKETPRQHLENDLANIRSIYSNDGLLNDVITDGIQQVRALNQKNYPKLFAGTT